MRAYPTTTWVPGMMGYGGTGQGMMGGYYGTGSGMMGR
jgi:hypothetical protein